MLDSMVSCPGFSGSLELLSVRGSSVKMWGRLGGLVPGEQNPKFPMGKLAGGRLRL